MTNPGLDKAMMRSESRAENLASIVLREHSPASTKCFFPARRLGIAKQASVIDGPTRMFSAKVKPPQTKDLGTASISHPLASWSAKSCRSSPEANKCHVQSHRIVENAIADEVRQTNHSAGDNGAAKMAVTPCSSHAMPSASSQPRRTITTSSRKRSLPTSRLT